MPKYLKKGDAELLKEHGIAEEEASAVLNLAIVTPPPAPIPKDEVNLKDVLKAIGQQQAQVILPQIIVPSQNDGMVEQLRDMVSQLVEQQIVLQKLVKEFKTEKPVTVKVGKKKFKFEIERDANGRFESMIAKEI